MLYSFLTSPKFVKFLDLPKCFIMNYWNSLEYFSHCTFIIPFITGVLFYNNLLQETSCYVFIPSFLCLIHFHQHLIKNLRNGYDYNKRGVIDILRYWYILRITNWVMLKIISKEKMN